MSTHSQRTNEPTVALTLADRIRMAGVEIGGQEGVPHRMELARLRLPDETTPEQLRRMWWRRLRNCTVRWYVTTVSEFNRNHTHKNGTLPERVEDDVRKIERHLPDVSLHVHALKWDPWLVATKGKETVYVRGWDTNGVFF